MFKNIVVVYDNIQYLLSSMDTSLFYQMPAVTLEL